MTFTLTITLGNAAMQTPYDVAEALRDAADKIANESPGEVLVSGDTMPIRDANGNRVGNWTVQD